MVNERIARKQKLEVETKLQEQCENDAAKTILSSNRSEADKKVNPLKLLINLENAKSMIRVVLRKRPNKGRKQILLVILSLSIIFGEQIGKTIENLG